LIERIVHLVEGLSYVLIENLSYVLNLVAALNGPTAKGLTRMNADFAD
jgi:hypothetical protein